MTIQEHLDRVSPLFVALAMTDVEHLQAVAARAHIQLADPVWRSAPITQLVSSLVMARVWADTALERLQGGAPDPGAWQDLIAVTRAQCTAHSKQIKTPPGSPAYSGLRKD